MFGYRRILKKEKKKKDTKHDKFFTFEFTLKCKLKIKYN